MPQAADAQVDGAVERVLLAALDEVHELIAAENAVGVTEEDLQQAELRHRQADRDATRRDQLVGGDIQLPAVKAVARDTLRRQADRLGLRPAQDIAHPGQQFTRFKGFGQVVVGAKLQTQNAVDGIGAGRQHEDGQAALAPQLAAEAESILAGQHQIEDDQIDAALLEYSKHLPAVGGQTDAVAVFQQIIPDQVADVAVVVDDQQVRFGFHGDIVNGCRRGCQRAETAALYLSVSCRALDTVGYKADTTGPPNPGLMAPVGR